jgi:hypothetical protein
MTNLKDIQITYPGGTFIAMAFPKTSAWEVASQYMSFLKMIGVEKVGFRVVWTDDESYSGNAEPAKDGYDFGAHLRDYCLTFTGKLKPAHMSQEQYEGAIKAAPAATVRKLAKYLKDYELTVLSQVKIDPLPSVTNLLSFRFDNVRAGQKAPVSDPHDRTDLNIFPDPPAKPVDPDDYVAKGFNAVSLAHLMPVEGKN